MISFSYCLRFFSAKVPLKNANRFCPQTITWFKGTQGHTFQVSYAPSLPRQRWKGLCHCAGVDRAGRRGQPEGGKWFGNVGNGLGTEDFPDEVLNLEVLTQLLHTYAAKNIWTGGLKSTLLSQTQPFFGFLQRSTRNERPRFWKAKALERGLRLLHRADPSVSVEAGCNKLSFCWGRDPRDLFVLGKYKLQVKKENQGFTCGTKQTKPSSQRANSQRQRPWSRGKTSWAVVEMSTWSVVWTTWRRCKWDSTRLICWGLWK